MVSPANIVMPHRYTRIAVTLHWLIAVLIAVNVALGLAFERLGDEWVRPAIDMHKSIGITVLGLAAMRLLWRATHPPPALPPSYGRLERRGAHAAHLVLYGLIFAMPLSGWLHDSAWKDAATHPLRLFGIVPWPRLPLFGQLDDAGKDNWHALLGTVHVGCGYVLYAMVAMHILGALKHQFIDREPELQRMWR